MRGGLCAKRGVNANGRVFGGDSLGPCVSLCGDSSSRPPVFRGFFNFAKQGVGGGLERGGVNAHIALTPTNFLEFGCGLGYLYIYLLVY